MTAQIRVKTFKKNGRWQVEVIESNVIEKPGQRLVPGSIFDEDSWGYDSRRIARQDLREFMDAFPQLKVIGGLH